MHSTHWCQMRRHAIHASGNFHQYFLTTRNSMSASYRWQVIVPSTKDLLSSIGHLRQTVRSLDWKPLSYLESEQKCDQAMEKAQSCPFRIVYVPNSSPKESADNKRSIFQGDSLSPLQCTRSTMLKILHRCNVDPAFLDILFKFGDQDQVFEESSGLSYASCEPDGSFGENF